MNKIHDIHLFNLNKIGCHYNNLHINELRYSLSDDLISNGYFYIQWLFPVIGVSKWHTNVRPFLKKDSDLLKEDSIAVDNIIKSADLVMNTFSLRRVGVNYFYENENQYWLRGIGHEEKKISRIAICLMQLGINDLAESLIEISCQTLQNKGFKTKSDVEKIIEFWHSLKQQHCLY